MDEGDFIKINLTGRVESGEVFETMDEEVAREEGVYDEEADYGPKVIVLGEDQVFPTLQDALLDAEPGDSGEVEVPPEEGFGERSDDKIVSLSKREYGSRFDQPARRGARVEMDGQQGVIVSAVGGHVRIDFNHPLAGQTLFYEYEVLEEIEEPEEKVRTVLDNATGADPDEFLVEIENGVVTIEPPVSGLQDQGWLLSKSRIADRLLSGLDADEVRFVEVFERTVGEEIEEELGAEDIAADEPVEESVEGSSEDESGAEEAAEEAVEGEESG